MTESVTAPSDVSPIQAVNLHTDPSPRSRGAVLASTLALAATGAVGAVIAWLAMNEIGEIFRLPPELAQLGAGQIPSFEDQQRLAAGDRVLQYQHAALWLGVCGAILGGLFGSVLGLFRSTRTVPLRGLGAGVLLGGIFGAGAGPLAVYIDEVLHDQFGTNGIKAAEHWVILMHAGIGLVIGIGIGIGTSFGVPGVGGKTISVSVLTAGLAGFLGGALYPVLTGLAMPMADATQSIPDADWSRLLWLGLPSVLIGLALGRKG